MQWCRERRFEQSGVWRGHSLGCRNSPLSSEPLLSSAASAGGSARPGLNAGPGGPSLGALAEEGCEEDAGIFTSVHLAIAATLNVMEGQ